MQCVILAGGLATRMWPITETTPKSLIPVGDVPFVHYQLNLLKSQGVDEVVFCIGHMGEKIRDYVASGGRWNLRVRYVDEGKELKGTGGAVRLAYERGVLQERFFLTYGDSYLPINYKAVWNAFPKSGREALMTVFHNEGKWDTSNVCYEAGELVLYDKARRDLEATRYSHIDYGLSILTSDLVAKEFAEGVKLDLATVMERLSRRGALAGYEVEHRFYEIGSMAGLKDFERYAQENLEDIQMIPPGAEKPSAETLGHT